MFKIDTTFTLSQELEIILIILIALISLALVLIIIKETINIISVIRYKIEQRRFFKDHSEKIVLSEESQDA